MNWTRITSHLLSLGVIALSMALVLSCGGDGSEGDEVVYLYIFNGYVGSKSMSLYGPSGKVVTGLSYGEATEFPIAVDRNLGTSFKLVVDGAPTTIDENFTLYSLYPQETGTLLFKKRTGLASADIVLYRHVQSITNRCRLVFDNALSLESAGLGEYGYVPGFELPNALAGGYDRSEREARTSVMDRIDQDPTFVFVPHFEAPGKAMLVHAGAGSEINYSTGDILTDRPTEDYENCLADTTGEDQSEAEKIEECRKQQIYTTHVYRPTTDQQYVIDFLPGALDPSAPNSCNAKVTIGSDFQNIFIDNKVISEDKFSFEPGNHMFWVLFGRPVNPGVLKFNTYDKPFAELPQ